MQIDFVDKTILVTAGSKEKSDYNKNLKNIINQSLIKRIAEPEEFVQLIIFLASEQSSYINSTAIAIDGSSSKSIY